MTLLLKNAGPLHKVLLSTGEVMDNTHAYGPSSVYLDMMLI